MQWRDLYLRLIHSYLFQNDVHSAMIVLSKIMPNLLPIITHLSSSSSAAAAAAASSSSTSTSTSSSSFPFAIRAWDAERLDLFNNDHAPVDFDLVRFWMIVFLKERNLEKSITFINLCASEPRLRSQEKAEAWIQSFYALSDYQVDFSVHSISHLLIPSFHSSILHIIHIIHSIYVLIRNSYSRLDRLFIRTSPQSTRPTLQLSSFTRLMQRTPPNPIPIHPRSFRSHSTHFFFQSISHLILFGECGVRWTAYRLQIT